MAPSSLTVPPAGPKKGGAPSPRSPHMATTTLRVGGMTCGACTSSVEAGFKGVEGVGNVSVSLVTERAVVQHDPTQISPEQVAEIIEDRGFDAEVVSSDMPQSAFEEDEDEDLLEAGGDATTTMEVKGMTCGACTSAIENAFKGVEGVKNFNVSLLSERAVVDHDPSVIAPEKLAEIIEDTGFDATLLETKSASAKSKRSKKGKMMTTTVSIEGMTCGACTSAVEAGFKDVDGLVQFNISLLAERAVIVHDPTLLPVDQIVEAIEDRGFDATVVSSVSTDAQSSSKANVQLKVFGLPSEMAASELEAHLSTLPGVSGEIKFDAAMSRASISYKPSQTGLRAIVESIEEKGFNALLADGDNNSAQLESLSKTKEIQEWRNAFRTSLCFAIPVFLTTMVFPMCLPFLDYGSIKLLPGIYLGDIVAIILTIPVQFGIGKRFYISAYRSLRHGSPTMDVLVVLGTSAAFFFSIVAMLVSFFTPPHTRPATVFDTSTMLITFITLGRFLENRAKGQTSKALSRLMSLAPSMATIYADPIAAAKTAEGWAAPVDEKDEDSERQSALAEKTIPTELLEVGDIVILKPGDKIPADGDVTRGQSYVDESMVTGEPMPILKKKGHNLMAGTVNGAGRVDFVVTRAGRDTQLSQIVRLVQEAQTSRAPIQRMADIIAGYFVPVIISLGLITFVTWMVLSHTLSDPPKIFTKHESGGAFMICLKLCISVIVFACPCALGLSTPTAVMVGTGVGAEQGILVKGGAALETATKVNHVVLDKTGTLTVGKMTVARADIRTNALQAVTHRSPMEEHERQRLWWSIVGLAEMGSEHPIAKAITLAAKDRLNIGPEGSFDGAVTRFDVIVGKGVSATIEPTIPGAGNSRPPFDILIGNLDLLRANGVHVPTGKWEEVDMESSEDTNASTTTIHIAILSTYAGSISLSDRLKPTARACIRALTRMGIKTSIVTGDSLPPALAVARAVGVPPERVHAGKTPEQKQEIVERLQGSGEDDLAGTPMGGPTGIFGFIHRLIKRRSWREKYEDRDTVAMVGDGINDSPALASAAVGIALASGTDVAMEAATIVLMQSSSSSESDISPGSSNDLLALPASLILSRTIFNRIKLNLLWATAYNFIGLPFAMGVFLPWGLSLHPMAAGAAMACSSVSVVLSSLALKWWKRPSWLTVQYLDPENAGDAPLPTKHSRNVSWVGKLRELVPKKSSKKEEETRGAYVPLQEVEDV
jgi:P-type Cu+ transporter